MRARAVGAAVLAAGLVAGAGVAWAGFSSTTSNESTFAAADVFPCTAPGEEVSVAVADSFVYGALGNTGSNFGSQSSLNVGSAVLLGLLGGELRSFVRFSAPDPPARCGLLSATLRLRATSSSGGRTIVARRVSASWTEGGITWSNQPGITGASTGSPSGSGWRTWDVTQHVEQVLAGAPNHGLRLADSASLLGANQTYSSREGSDPPELVLEWGDP